MKITRTGYTHRYLSRIILQAATPLSISSGEESIMTDSLILLDVNNLPYIPGTTLAGVIRHIVESKNKSVAEDIFGYHEGDKSHGSSILFTDAKIVGPDGVVDGIKAIDFNDEFYSLYKYLPIRQHTRITDKGAVMKGAKFDEQIIPKGTRFCFEIELIGNEEQKNMLPELLKIISSKSFRIGGGSRSGFGMVDIVSIQTTSLDLSKDMNLYLEKSSSLDESGNWIEWKSESIVSDDSTLIEYTLELKATDFVHFGSGHGDSDVDDSPLSEKFVIWKDNKPTIAESNHIIPGSSIKGAVAHRVAYHYNKLIGAYVGSGMFGKDNEAVKNLFGSEGDMGTNGLINKKCGVVLFSDMIENCYDKLPKVFNHVSINQFTSGALSGHLFSESTIYAKDRSYNLSIVLPGDTYDKYVKALELSLKDICIGLLPLGGFVNRGHGSFIGKLLKNGEEIYG